MIYKYTDRLHHTVHLPPLVYKYISQGSKTLFLREDNRDFRPGDILVLKDWDPERHRYVSKGVIKLIDSVNREGLFLAVSLLNIDNHYIDDAE